MRKSVVPVAFVVLTTLGTVAQAKEERETSPPDWKERRPIGLLSDRGLAKLIKEDVFKEFEPQLKQKKYVDQIMMLNDDSKTPTTTKAKFRWPWSGDPPAYLHTGHAFGFIPPSPAGSTEPVAISHAGAITDRSLLNSRIKITLDKLRIADYPGRGLHQIMFDFSGQNQLPNGAQTEELRFAQSFRAQEGESVGAIGYPVFVGLNVGTAGVSFKFRTINVENQNDEKLMDALDSDVVKSGLKLATTAQPVIAPFTAIATSITKAVLSRNRNVVVQEVFMGLDFDTGMTGVRLAPGAYVVVQIPDNSEATWKWSEWIYSPINGEIVNRSNPAKLIPYNYVIFRVSRYDSDSSTSQSHGVK